MTPWPSIASLLAQKLRLHCRCQFDYDRKLVKQCGNCAALAQYDRAVAEMQIIQRTRYHANCATCTCGEPGETK